MMVKKSLGVNWENLFKNIYLTGNDLVMPSKAVQLLDIQLSENSLTTAGDKIPQREFELIRKSLFVNPDLS